MKKFLLIYLLAFPLLGFNQIAINTTGNAPDASAALDVDWAGKGLLIPRISLTSNTDGTTISSPATSLLVYNTNASMTGGQGVGYYYNAGTPASPNWVKFLVGKEAWMITGNDNTDPATNFLGTTNDKDLQFRTNNLNRMRIMSSSYSTYPTVGIGTTVPVINLDGNSAVLHVHDGGNSVGSQLVLSTHSTTAGARSGGLFFAATQATNNRITANIQSYLTAYSGGNASGDLRFFTNNNNSVAERMRLYETGQLVLSDNTTFPSATANFLFTIQPTTNNYRSGISIPMSGASSTAYAINVSTANANSRGYFYENTSGSNGVFYGAGSQLSTTNIASGYLSYRNSSGLTYGIYGINGTNAAYTTNANVWAAFIQGRAVISSESSPTSPLGVDLEIRNTTTGSGYPATLSMRQTTTETTSGRTLARLNFGDNHTTDPQAQISILRDAAGGSGDYPTAILFSTTPDGSSTLTERMRIVNNGNVGIGTTSPSTRLDVQGGHLTVGTIYGTNVMYGTLGSYDTRATNPAPETYNMGILSEFKGNAANSLNDGGTYNSVISVRQWGSSTDWSGGGVHQLGFTQNGNIWHRYSQTTGSWGPWKRLLDSGMGGLITCSNSNYVIKSDGTNGICSQIYDDGTNVGIGTTSPTHKLTIQSSTISTLRLIGPGSFGSTARLNFGDGNYVYIEEDADDYLTIYGSNRTAIMGGNVGIGQTNPAYNLEINGTFGFGNGTAGSYRSRTETRDNAGLQASQSGFFETSSPTNYPAGASSWWHLIDCRHSNNGNNYAMQLAGSFFDQKLYFRKTNNNAAQPWTEVLTGSYFSTNVQTVESTSTLSITSTTFTQIPGESITIGDLRAGDRVLVWFGGNMNISTYDYNIVDVALFINGTMATVGGFVRTSIDYDYANKDYENYFATARYNVPSDGSYTFDVRARRLLDGDPIYIGGDSSDSREGVLTIFVIRN